MSTIENCPLCEGKMEKGYVSTAERIWWGKNKPGPIVLKGDEVLGGSFLTGTVLEAYRCSNCKIILFSYEIKG